VTEGLPSTAFPIRVGTAGWLYDDWKGIVYPAAGRGLDRLALMASLFDTNEINSTFYRIPEARQTADWSRRVAHNPRFAFTAKLFRGFTHERKARAAEEKAFLQAVEPLRADGRLGCVLVQFPMSFHDTPENRATLRALLARFRELPLAVEFRHDSWDRGQTRQLLAEHSAAFVNIDQPRLRGNLPPTSYVTAPIAYYRFHGRNAEKWFGPETSNEQRYNYLYSEEELAPWVERIRSAASDLAREEVRAAGLAGAEAASPASARREDPARGVYAILNNHFRGQAVANAVELQQLLTGEVRKVPETLTRTYPGLAAVAGAEPPAQRRLF
jgi:uncharacterized protein YecE (DUF72 family)